MLSLISSSSPNPSGTRSLVNCVIVWRTPSSYTSNASRGSPLMRRPSLSRTVAVMLVSSMPLWNGCGSRIRRLLRRAERERARDENGNQNGNQPRVVTHVTC